MNHFLKTVTEIFTSEFKERGSKFIGYLIPAKSEEEFDEQLQKLKTELWDASHHCYAYRIGASDTTEFSSDDGEPSGTAGLPILNQLRSNELVDVCAVVVRYFGGTKLGKSGLIESYGESIRLAIEAAKLLEIKLVQFVQVTYPYSQENTINKLILDYELEEQEADYLANVSKLFACPVKNVSTFKASLEALEHLSISHKMLHKSYIYL
ncbi:YigZ family protein [bacterium]|nr:YigZ family protein [Balneola sp.]MBR9916601.1 YigZ family protein [bacterium]